MNYRIDTFNYIECDIVPTEEKADNVSIFISFNKAKKAYIKTLRMHRDNWNIEIKIALKHTKKLTDNKYFTTL